MFCETFHSIGIFCLKKIKSSFVNFLTFMAIPAFKNKKNLHVHHFCKIHVLVDFPRLCSNFCLLQPLYKAKKKKQKKNEKIKKINK